MNTLTLSNDPPSEIPLSECPPGEAPPNEALRRRVWSGAVSALSVHK